MSAVHGLADQWNATPDYLASEYDRGRVHQRHMMTTQLLEAIEADTQSEPSDAQVLAALKAVEPRANWDDPVVWRGNPGWVKTMRAALRAAGATS